MRHGDSSWYLLCEPGFDCALYEPPADMTFPHGWGTLGTEAQMSAG